MTCLNFVIVTAQERDSICICGLCTIFQKHLSEGSLLSLLPKYSVTLMLLATILVNTTVGGESTVPSSRFALNMLNRAPDLHASFSIPWRPRSHPLHRVRGCHWSDNLLQGHCWPGHRHLQEKHSLSSDAFKIFLLKFQPSGNTIAACYVYIDEIFFKEVQGFFRFLFAGRLHATYSLF